MPSEARQQFEGLIGFVDQLVTIHGKLQQGQGRRHEQDAIHRSGVVLTVAAWESYIEKVVMESLDAMETAADAGTPPGGLVPTWARQAFALRRAEIGEGVKKFNTPDATKVRDLLEGSVGFSPWPHWNRRSGPRQWGEKEMRARLNAWVLVRHSVAHGFPLPSDVEWLQDARGRPRLTLELLRECRKFFKHLVEQTDEALASRLDARHGIPKPW